MDSINPKFSILSLTLGQSNFRWSAIESVLQQDYGSWELILIDPSSETFIDSRVQELIDKDERVVCIDTPDSGPAQGLNNGLQRATGEFVLCLNGDDFILKDCLQKVANIVDSEMTDDFAVIHGNSILVDEKSTKVKLLFSDHISILNFSSGEYALPHPSTFYRREFLAANNIDFNERNRTCWDAEITLNILQCGGRFLRMNEFLSAFRLHPNSISGSGALTAEYDNEKKRILSAAKEIESHSALRLNATALFLILKRKLRLWKSK